MPIAVANQLSTSTTNRPGDLQPGQIAFNGADLRLFLGDGSNDFKLISGQLHTPGPTAGLGWQEYSLTTSLIISSPLTLNIDPAGSATPANPLAGDAFNLLSTALAWLDDKVLLAPVTLNMVAGVYAEPASITIDHPQAINIEIAGPTVTVPAITSNQATRVADNAANETAIRAAWGVQIEIDGNLQIKNPLGGLSDVCFVRAGTQRFVILNGQSLDAYDRVAFVGFGISNAGDAYRFRFCVFSASTRQGILNRDKGNRILIEDSYISGSEQPGYEGETSGAVLDNTIVSGCDDYGVEVEACSLDLTDVTVQDCRLDGLFGRGSIIRAFGTCTFTANDTAGGVNSEQIRLRLCQFVYSGPIDLRTDVNEGMNLSASTFLPANTIGVLSSRNIANTADMDVTARDGSQIFVITGGGSSATYIPALNAPADADSNVCKEVSLN